MTKTHTLIISRFWSSEVQNGSPRAKMKVSARPRSFWRLQGRICLLAFSGCEGHPQSLACGPFLHRQSQQRWAESLSLPSLQFSLHWVHGDNPGHLPHARSANQQPQFHLQTQFPFPCGISYSQVPGIRTQTYSGASFCPPQLVILSPGQGHGQRDTF